MFMNTLMIMGKNRRVPHLYFSGWLLGLLPAMALCAALAGAAPPGSSGTFGAVASGATITLPDPKLPGKLLCVIHAASATGQAQQNGFLGSMTGVSAQLFQQGRPSATLTAPRAQGGSVKKTVTVTGTGGVVIHSLTQPGTTLTADTVVWYASLNKIVATGHVFYRSGKTGATLTGPQGYADTRLRSIHLGPGHGSVTL